MSKESFASLLEFIGPIIAKLTTHLRQPISAETRFAVTLRDLASGEREQPLAWSYQLWVNYHFKDYTGNMPNSTGGLISNFFKISRYRGGREKHYQNF